MKIMIALYTFISIGWLTIIFSMQWSVLQTINISFLSGIIAMLIGVALYIIHSGFFSLLIQGFKKVHRKIINPSHAMERVDGQIKNDIDFQTWKHRVYQLCLRSALCFAVASITVSVSGMIIYYF